MGISIEQVAKVCHQANKALCDAVGDGSQVDWEHCGDLQRESVVAGVQLMLPDPTMTAEDLHKLWAEHKIAVGWIYGPVKDAEKKTHPCLVPYADLSAEQQTKDALFAAVVEALRPLVDVVEEPAVVRRIRAVRGGRRGAPAARGRRRGTGGGAEDRGQDLAG